MKYYLSPEAIAAGCTFEPPRIGDAGADLCALVEGEFEVIHAHSQLAIRTGLHLEIPEGFVGVVKDRSGLARDYRIYTNGGIIDNSFRGEILILLENRGYGYYKIFPGDKIAQLLILEDWMPREFEQVFSLEELSQTERGEDGFGSTDG